MLAVQILQGRYQLQQKLGQNASRQTWLAIDLATSDRQPVIVKLLAFDSTLQWDSFQLFEREAEALKSLNHPQIPKYRDYFHLDGDLLWLGLVQEYIPGPSLKELLNQGKSFTEQQVREIAMQVLEILIYLHELNPPVLHRDIKPSNLIWSEEKVYLVDFGAVQHGIKLDGDSLTVVGTYGYTPIEQFGGRAVPASDLYALGATLIHLLTGTVPADLLQPDLQIQFPERMNCSTSMVCWLRQMSTLNLEKRFSSARLALLSLESGITLPDASALMVPEEIKGWNWGAFLLAPIWGLSNRVWLGLLAWVPIVGFWVAIALGVKGNEWAWKSRNWQSIQQFQLQQKRWTKVGIAVGMAINLVFWQLGILILIAYLF